MQNTIRCSWRPRALAALAAAALVSPALAGTILVPQQHATIQAGINAAANGDTVVVAPGFYSGPGNYNLNLNGKAITVRSAAGAASCTISAAGDPDEERAGFMLVGVQSALAVIDGFTVTGGNQFNGGGIYIGGEITVQNCTFTGNYADCWGGGVYCESNSTPTVRNCRIVGNHSGDDGGGVFTISSNARVENCIIDGNTARLGAGVCVFGGQPIFVNCRITNNAASSQAGGILLWQGHAVNCTISGNSAAHSGAGAYLANGGTIANSIIYGNTGPTPVVGTVGITYSIVQGGFAGEGNLDAGPMFANAAAGNYRLLPPSPAIDAGSSVAVPAGVTTDLAGAKRIADAPMIEDTGVVGAFGMVVDMGAYEHGARKIGGVMR